MPSRALITGFMYPPRMESPISSTLGRLVSSTTALFSFQLLPSACRRLSVSLAGGGSAAIMPVAVRSTGPAAASS
ncbi:hypothetical protein [Verrucomicrobium spinosum]|uniref:hypothetical protein n=1 Tax=Verrucomicrobium spinosum TaxID=2736 RepID=UPI001C449FE6